MTYTYVPDGWFVMNPRRMDELKEAERAITTLRELAATVPDTGTPPGLTLSDFYDCRCCADTRTPPGLTLSEDESLLNWRGVNYVRQVPDTRCTYLFPDGVRCTLDDDRTADWWCPGWTQENS